MGEGEWCSGGGGWCSEGGGKVIKAKNTNLYKAIGSELTRTCI